MFYKYFILDTCGWAFVSFFSPYFVIVLPKRMGQSKVFTLKKKKWKEKNSEPKEKS